MTNPLTAVYDWLLLAYIRLLIQAALGPVDTDEERAKADFIVHGGDVEFIECIEESFGVGWEAP